MKKLCLFLSIVMAMFVITGCAGKTQKPADGFVHYQKFIEPNVDDVFPELSNTDKLLANRYLCEFYSLDAPTKSDYLDLYERSYDRYLIFLDKIKETEYYAKNIAFFNNSNDSEKFKFLLMLDMAMSFEKFLIYKHQQKPAEAIKAAKGFMNLPTFNQEAVLYNFNIKKDIDEMDACHFYIENVLYFYRCNLLPNYPLKQE